MKYVAYYRVSTVKQGESGLGLEAQKFIVKKFCKAEEYILAEYTEIESGKNNNRKELFKAMSHAQKEGATLLIAKLDRLSRNLTFISSLMDSGVHFTCCDMPEANEFTIHIFAALAQQERKLISKRTKEALQAKKARGEKIGTPENFNAHARAIGARAVSEIARKNEANLKVTGYIKLLRDSMKLSYGSIAEKLNAEGFKTRKGCNFKSMSVKRLYERNL